MTFISLLCITAFTGSL